MCMCNILYHVQMYIPLHNSHVIQCAIHAHMYVLIQTMSNNLCTYLHGEGDFVGVVTSVVGPV